MGLIFGKITGESGDVTDLCGLRLGKAGSLKREREGRYSSKKKKRRGIWSHTLSLLWRGRDIVPHSAKTKKGKDSTSPVCENQKGGVKSRRNVMRLKPKIDNWLADTWISMAENQGNTQKAGRRLHSGRNASSKRKL